jgi:hypothetical protein
LSNVIHEGTQINVKQQIKPSVYGNRPVYSPIFDDIYTSEILVEFDYSNVDFSEIHNEDESNSKKQEESTVSTN